MCIRDSLMPLCKPALVSVGLFNFIWTWNAFMDPLIYISSVKKYPLSLALRMTLDLGSAAAWNEIFAMSVLSILPPVLDVYKRQGKLNATTVPCAGLLRMESCVPYCS